MTNAQERDVVELETAPKTDRKQKIISTDDPLKAFQVILANADVAFIQKLGALLTNVSAVMVNDTQKPIKED